MSLRLRLGLASVALAGPLLVALTWLRVEAAARAEEDTLVQRGRQLMHRCRLALLCRLVEVAHELRVGLQD